MLQSRLHVIERRRLNALARDGGLAVPEPWMGVLDVLRMINGHVAVPPERRPLGVHGFDALVAAAPGDAQGVLHALRLGFI